MTMRKQAQGKRTQSKRTASGKRKWSANVTAHSDAMDLSKDVFKKSPSAIAKSLKRSAERSHRHKSPPFRSAMSMLTFYTNRAGKNLTPAQRKKLNAAKNALRREFNRE